MQPNTNTVLVFTLKILHHYEALSQLMRTQFSRILTNEKLSLAISLHYRFPGVRAVCGADTVRPLLLSFHSALPARPAENILEFKNILVRTRGVISPADHSATGELRQ